MPGFRSPERTDQSHPSIRIFRERKEAAAQNANTNLVREADRDVIRFRPPALFGAGIIIAILFFAREVFIPLSLAILLSFLLEIPCTFLERRGFKRGVAVSLLVVLSCGA